MLRNIIDHAWVESSSSVRHASGNTGVVLALICHLHWRQGMFTHGLQ
jgi:hypothetical protein